MRHHTLLAGVLLATAGVAPRAVADTAPQAQATAEVLYEQSAQLAQQQRWAEAAQKLVASNQIDPAVGTYLRLGDCYERLGRSASAWTAYSEAISLAHKLNDKRATFAEENLKRVEPTLSRVVLAVAPQNRTANITIKRDGLALPEAAWDAPVPVDPGEHTLEASAPGKQPWTTTTKVEAKPGLTTVQIPALEDAPSQPVTPARNAPGAPIFWGPQRITGTTVAAAGVAGLAIGAAFGALTLQKISASKSDGNCNASLTVCNPDGLQMQSDAHTLAHASTAALVIGGAALAAGVAIFATAPSAGGAPAQTKSGAWLSLGTAAGADMTGILVRGGW